jgi:hypothetical protein
MVGFGLPIQERESPILGPSEVSFLSLNEPFSLGVLGALAVENFD